MFKRKLAFTTVIFVISFRLETKEILPLPLPWSEATSTTLAITWPLPAETPPVASQSTQDDRPCKIEFVNRISTYMI